MHPGIQLQGVGYDVAEVIYVNGKLVRAGIKGDPKAAAGSARRSIRLVPEDKGGRQAAGHDPAFDGPRRLVQQCIGGKLDGAAIKQH